MIQKTWTDKRIYRFCKKHKFSFAFNEYATPFNSFGWSEEITKYVDRNHTELVRMLDWCADNCFYRYELCQWHLGYENNVVLRFYSKEDHAKFYSFYDKTFFPKVEVETK